MPATEAASRATLPPPRPAAKGMRVRPGTLLRVCAVVLVLGLAAEAYRVFLGSNVHPVIPGRVYRCAQPSGPELEDLIRAHSIRTVVNLRGSCAPIDWYMDESRATVRQDVAQEDICFSAGRMPGVHEIRHLLEVLDRTEYPILLHCKQGADRTGMASALALL